mgnify:CR=1 FL=1
MKAQASSESVFEDMPIRQAVRTMAVPTVIGQLIVLIYNLADTYFIGKTNSPAMVAGVSLILPLFNLTLALGSLFGTGGGALLPRLLAADDRNEAACVAAYCMRMSILTALVFSLLMLILLRPVLQLLGAGESTFPYARIYLITVLIIGGLPTILSNTLSNLLRSLGLSREAGTAVAMGGVLNIILDPLFMFVLLPRGNEVLGVGIATLLSNLISLCFCLFVFFRKQQTIPADFFLPAPKREHIRAVYTIGIPGTTGAVLFDLDYMVLDKLVSAYGDAALAAIGIVLKAERLPQQIGIGLCQGMVPLVSYSHAKQNYSRIRGILSTTLKAGAVVALVSVTVYEIFTPRVITFFIREPETFAIGNRFLRVRCLAAVIMFFCFFVVFFYQATGDGKRAMSLALLRWAVLNIPMLYLFNFLFGMYGLVWSQVVSDLLTVLISFLILRRTMQRWKE